MYALGIDLGTTFTAAAVLRDGRAEISSLGSRAASIPSVVVLREDATIITGEPANRRALSEPHRVAREFKRRLGDSTPILLGGSPYSAEALMAKLLRAVVDEVSAREGGAPGAVCVSHPANWGPFKTDLLRQAVRAADLEDVVLTTEPEAAAVFYARQQRVPDGAVIAVYDLGGGTFDAAVLRKTGAGFEILGRPEGIERLGGIDIDAAVYAHVARALGGALDELDDEDPAVISAVARLREECTEAKEALSSDTDTTIPVLLPNLSTEVRLTRGELESMVRPVLQDTVDALRRALRSADVTPEDLHSVLLVGGSSRMPIVAQLIGAELGRPVAVDAHPKHAVALGAAWLAGGAEESVAAPALPAVPVPVPVPAPEPQATELIPALVSEDEDLPFPVPAAASSPAGPPSLAGLREATPPRQGRRGLLIGAAAAAVLVVAGGVYAGTTLLGDKDSGTPSGALTSSASPSSSASSTPSEQPLPADEQCTDEIKANERWVCLTGATFDGTKLTIKYKASFAGMSPNIHGGYHLHIYGANEDGSDPAAEDMGKQSANPGHWYIEDAKPSERTASSDDYQEAIGDAPKVCARIATAAHKLVPDANGTYVTGNCVPIDRS